MAKTPGSIPPEPPDNERNTAGDSPIRVQASEQLAPDAALRCPVCGLEYALGGIPLSQESGEAKANALAMAAHTENSEPHLLMRCARCGTYSVGNARPSPNGPVAEE